MIRRTRVWDFPADIYEFYLPYQLFWRYTSLCCCYNHHSLFHRNFSDDNQLYASAHASEVHEIISFTQGCVSDVQVLMRRNKTQTRQKWFSLLQNISRKTQTLPSTIQMNSCDIPLSTSVPNLGVTLDQTFFPATHNYTVHIRLAISSFIESVPHPQCSENPHTCFCSVPYWLL